MDLKLFRRSADRKHSRYGIVRREWEQKFQRIIRQGLGFAILYIPLRRNEIRVLKLLPGTENDPLRASLEVVSLGNHPSYQAISYTWGPQVYPDSLIFPQKTVKITRSLSGALRRFRDDHRPLYLWADAVCIDQRRGKTYEREKQLGLMARVYQRADTTLMWLGEEQPFAATAFWMIKFLVSFGRTYLGPEDKPIDDVEFALEGLPRAFQAEMARDGSPMCPCCQTKFEWTTESWSDRLNEGLHAFCKVLELSWFERLWVVQEYAMSVHSRFYLGRHWTVGDDLYHALHATKCCIAFNYFKRVEPPLNIDRINEVGRIDVLGHLFRNYMEKPDSGSNAHCLLDVLIGTAHLKASNPQDRLFSIRAIAFVEDVMELAPDLTLPINELWTRVARYLLTTTSRWDIPGNDEGLCQCIVLSVAGLQGRQGPRTLPSWVPDMSVLDEEAHRKYHFSSLTCVTNAAGGLKRSKRFWVDVDRHPDILYVRAVSLAKVTKILPDSQYNPNAHEPPSDYPLDEWDELYWLGLEFWLVPWYLRCYHFAGKRTKNPAKVDQLVYSFSTLMTHGIVYDSPQAQRPLDALTTAHHKFFRNLLGTYYSEDQLPDVPTPERMYVDLSTFLSLTKSASFIDRTRVLARTSDGRVGWIPGHSEAGDIVCLFEGASEPYIIRYDGEGLFTVLGDAYIHGVMYGEAWPPDLDENKIRVIGLK